MATETPYEHGKESTYINWACRCTLCVNAARDARNGRRAGLPEFPSIPKLALSADERTELASYMIDAWTAFAGLKVPKKRR